MTNMRKTHVTKKAKKVVNGVTSFAENNTKLILGLALFFLIFLLVSLFTSGFTSFSSTPNDMIILLSSENCVQCSDAREVIRAVAKDIGIPFKEAGYNIPEMLPSFILVYNDEVLISPFRGKELFTQQVQGFMDEHK